MTKAIPAGNMDISTKLAYLELLVPSSAEASSTSKLAQKSLVRSMYVSICNGYFVCIKAASVVSKAVGTTMAATVLAILVFSLK